MIDHGTLLSIPFLKKSRFTGSDRGMRYSIYKVEETRVIPNDASEEAPKEENASRGSRLPRTIFRRFYKARAVYKKAFFI